MTKYHITVLERYRRYIKAAPSLKRNEWKRFGILNFSKVFHELKAGGWKRRSFRKSLLKI